MGDLNSLSPLDQAQHHQEHLAHLLLVQHKKKQPNLRQKLLNATGHINYKPIQTLLDSGLQDSCAVSCEQRQALGAVGVGAGAQPSVDGGTRAEAVQECMLTTCRASEPTLFNPEVSRGLIS